VVALAILIDEGYVKPKHVDWFETVYHARGGSAQLRKDRWHEGHPARAPDGTIMYQDTATGTEAWGGDEGGGVEHGEWTIETVKNCPGYKEWLEKLKWGTRINDINDKDLINSPYPDVDACEKANRLADARLKPGKLAAKKETDAKQIAELRKDLERENAERNELKQRAAEREEAERKARESKQRISKARMPKQKSPASIADRKLSHGQQQQIVDTDSDGEDQGEERESKRRRMNKSLHRSKMLIDKYKDDAPEDVNDDRSGDNLRRHADNMEEEFEGALKRYATYLDKKFSNKGETRHRKSNFWERVGSALGVSKDKSQDGSSSTDEGSHKSSDEDEMKKKRLRFGPG